MQSLFFFGSDQYSAIVLSHLLQNWKTGALENLTVVTDQRTDPTPVEVLAKSHNLNVLYYPTKTDEMITLIDILKSFIINPKSTQSEIGLCASFDHLLPKNIIELFAGNLYNLHPSLLPQYRNVSPVQYAIALGDKVTGITLFRISPGIDDGEIIAQASDVILPIDTTPTLTSRLFALGAELFLTSSQSNFPSSHKSSIINLESNELVFTHRLTRASGFIEWNVLLSLLNNARVDPSQTTNKLLLLRLKRDTEYSIPYTPYSILTDLVRALSPWPGIWSLVPKRKKIASNSAQTDPEPAEGGELRISIPPIIQNSDPMILVAGKPKAITLSEFTKYYL